MHFYIILPVMLLATRRRPLSILLVVVAALSMRYVIWQMQGEVQSLAYWTIIGCHDYFVLGIAWARLRHHGSGRHAVALIVALFLLIFIYQFDQAGGFYRTGSYPSGSPIWIYYSTVMGAGFAFLIAWYDTSFSMPSRGVSGLIARVGACSYSIYLLHVFVVFRMSNFVNAHIIDLSDDAVMIPLALVAFIAFVPFAYLSYLMIELPPMTYRRRYAVGPATA